MPDPISAVIGGVASVGSSIIGSNAADDASDAQVDAAENAAAVQKEMYYQSRDDLAPWRIAGNTALDTLLGETSYKLAEPNRSEFITGQNGSTFDEDSYNAALRLYNNGGTRLDGGGGGPLPNKADFTKTTRQNFDEEGYNTAQKNYLDSSYRTGGLLTNGPAPFVPENDPGYKFGYSEFVENPTLKMASATGKLRSGATQKALTRYASDYASTKYDNHLSRYYQSLNPYLSLSGAGQISANQSGVNAIATGRGVSQTMQDAGDARASGYINQSNALTGGINNLTNMGMAYKYMQ